VLFGILNGIDPLGVVVGVVNLYGVNLYGTCPVVPLGVMILGVKPGDGSGFEDSGEIGEPGLGIPEDGDVT